MMDFMEGLARGAGDVLFSHFGEDRTLIGQRYSVKEALTTHDRAVDELIVRQIRERYPEHSLLTEESGSLSGSPEWLWIVDSLDGTVNFACSNPLVCVCIAVMHDGQLTSAAVYAPAIGELYLAEKGNGAYLNGTRIRVSDVSDLGQSYVYYCEGGEEDRVRTGDILSTVYPRVMDVRKLGSAGLETAWVAAGKGDAYFTTRIEPWDVAAGVLMVREAGGEVSDFGGGHWRLETSDLVFSNGRLHPEMLGLLLNERVEESKEQGSGLE